MTTDDAKRAAFLDQLNVMSNATYHRLSELDHKYRQAGSDDSTVQARHAAVRYELRRRGYIVTTE
jgi:hypothetical protein